MATFGAELRTVVRQRVGGFFHNTFRVSGLTCSVCTGPATNELCAQCASQRRQFGDDLADRVFTLTYAQGNQPGGQHQSAYTVRAYKNPTPVQACVDDMHLVLTAAMFVHSACMQESAGTPWDLITYVPSADRPGPEHPAAELARRVDAAMPGTRGRIRLGLGPEISDVARAVLADRFSVDASTAERVAGRHVLVVDDTWTSGSKMQSAALALHRSGAEAVTGLCIDRWCRWDWADHAEFLRTLDTPYDPLACPAGVGTCERALSL